ncbi:hypothetical protein M9H77_08794 [Catharanthus roseus]|uniref:Uncharacterized protein n=1 Tax=Catharanthus roseus TaxID=4058 RepID=A0ACC0BZ02_CATRO|nr:hypothetical protein M9H77_08794 [Catharanthus roseus]
MYTNIIFDYSTRAASSRAPYMCGLFKTVDNYCELGFDSIQGYSSGYDHVFESIRGLHCVASPPYEGLFRWSGRFRLGRVDLLEEGNRPRRVWTNSSTWTLHHALRWDGRLVESQEGLETEVAAKVLGLEFWTHFSLEGYVVNLGLCFCSETYSLVSFNELKKRYGSKDPE